MISQASRGPGKSTLCVMTIRITKTQLAYMLLHPLYLVTGNWIWPNNWCFLTCAWSCQETSGNPQLSMSVYAHCNGSLFPIACLTCWSHVFPLICESAWTVDQRWAVLKNRRRCASINQIPTLCSFITRICLFFWGFSNIQNQRFFDLGSWKWTPQIGVSPIHRYFFNPAVI
jgi:hypothetical protein